MIYVLIIYIALSIIFIGIAFTRLFGKKLRKKYINKQLIWVIPAVVIMGCLWLPLVIFEMIRSE